MKQSREYEDSSLLVSVIIPVYNGERYLADAIDSVLDQTYSALEIIVVDDGSTDNSRRVLEGYGDDIRYFRQDNKGTASARNFGVRNSQGSLLAFLDQDDLWVPDKLQNQVGVMAESNVVQAVFGMVEQFICPTMSESFNSPSLYMRLSVCVRCVTVAQSSQTILLHC